MGKREGSVLPTLKSERYGFEVFAFVDPNCFFILFLILVFDTWKFITDFFFFFKIILYSIDFLD
jgi:hypothetical protein